MAVDACPRQRALISADQCVDQGAADRRSEPLPLTDRERGHMGSPAPTVAVAGPISCEAPEVRESDGADLQRRDNSASADVGTVECRIDSVVVPEVVRGT